jgi:hypothetical protein
MVRRSRSLIVQKLFRLSTVVFALFLGLSPVAAGASPPTQDQATGVVLFSGHTQTLVRTAGGNSTFTAVDQLTLTGGISGNAVDTYTFTVHPDGSVTGHGIETCSACTIGGQTGGYTEMFLFTATPNFATFQGPFVFLSGTDGLAGLRGQGTFQGELTSTGFSETVQLNYHFEP